jgi:protein ImuB
VRVEPTPGRIVQWSLLERAQPSPEQVSTLLARPTALMGESHVGSPQLVDSWRPGAFAIRAFQAGLGTRGSGLGKASALAAPTAECLRTVEQTWSARLALTPSPSPEPRAPSPESRAPSPCSVAFRRFRLPVPARVTVQDGRPVRLMPDRRGVSGGEVVDCAGPWRTSGHWWDEPAPDAATAASRGASPWDRDEWDLVLADGVSCRVYLERDVGQWFVEGCFD